ncbi:fukutin [Trichonephila inaurata madagascariensis]|uniref:Fukutin n=1 Tax=Trichonephila inaurata madagascariensis TaxID=2747483 RepID=A0A8X6KH44_9ARAC|nr:fukutin [Trichonephila inaurata madagascariensis]
MVTMSAGFLIGKVIVFRLQMGNSTDDLIYKPNTSLPLEGAASVLGWDYGKCLTEPTKTFCHKTEKERAKMLAEKQNMKHQSQEMNMNQQEMKDNAPSGNVTSTAGTKHHWHPVHSLLHTFNLLMMSLDIRPLILEPSMLYCTLSPTYKIAVLKRGFSPSRFKGSRQMITVGIFERDSVILEEEESQNMVSDYGFQMEIVKQGILNEVVHSHFFFNHHDLVVHAVVFFSANTFFTHFGLPQKDTEVNLLFNVNSAYENFTYIPLEIKEDLVMKYNIPSNPAQFLLQIQNSEVEYCSSSDETVKTASHPTLTEKQLINRAVVAIQELKAVLLSRLIDFFLFEDSLIDWHKTCNIFHTKPELNVGVLSTAVKGMNLSEIWRNSEYLKIQNRSGLEDRELKVSLDCHGLRVNFFICYKTKLGLWYYRKERLELFPNQLLDPTFRLCSTDVLGQRVNIPCRAKVPTDTETSELGTLLTLNASKFNE